MRRAAPLVVALSLAISSCTGGGNRSIPPQTGAPVSRGGTLVTGMYTYRPPGPSFDPQTGYSSAEWELFRCCLLRTLLSYNGKSTAEGGAVLRPDLATGMPTQSDDGLTWTFHLKTGIRYAPPLEDQEIVAGDFVRALDREARVTAGNPAPGYPFYYSVIEGFNAARRGESTSISGLDVPDDSTLVVHLTRPTGDLPFFFSFPATAPIPADPNDPTVPFGVATGHDDDYARFLVASGPYMYAGSDKLDLAEPASDQTPVAGFVPWEPTGPPFFFGHGSLTLVRNPSWDPETDPLRPAYVDRIRILIGDVPGGTKYAGYPERAVRNGSMDLMFDTNPYWRIVRAYEADPSQADLIQSNEVGSVTFLQMNMAEPPFDDVNVRRAVNLAVDKQGLLQIFGRSFTPGPGVIASHLVPDSLEDNLLSSYRPSWAGSGGADTDSLAAARVEMMRSVYDANGDGRCDAPACRSVRLYAFDDTAEGDQGTWAEAAQAIRGYLRPLGIMVRVVLLPTPDLWDTVNDPSGHVPLVLDVWLTDYPGGSTIFSSMLYGPSISAYLYNLSLIGASPSLLAAWGYSTSSVPSADDEIDQCSLLVAQAQVTCWAELDKHLMETVVPWVPLEFPTAVRTISTRVVNFSFDQFTGFPSLDRIALAPDGG